MTVPLFWMHSSAIKSSTSEDRKDVKRVIGCPQIFLEDGGQLTYLMWLQLVWIKKERAGSLPLSSYSCTSAWSPAASCFALQKKYFRQEADEQGRGISSHQASELVWQPIDNCLWPLWYSIRGVGIAMRHRTGAGMSWLATFTHLEKEFEERRGSGELTPAQLLNTAATWGVTATTDERHQWQTLT